MNLIPRSFYLDDVFDDFPSLERRNELKCDIYEKDNVYHVEMDIPGFDKKDVKIECDNGYLTITAERQEQKNSDEDKNYIRRERRYGKYQRSFNFGDIDEDSITANFSQGMLKITIPKKEIKETKKIINID